MQLYLLIRDYHLRLWTRQYHLNCGRVDFRSPSPRDNRLLLCPSHDAHAIEQKHHQHHRNRQRGEYRRMRAVDAANRSPYTLLEQDDAREEDGNRHARRHQAVEHQSLRPTFAATLTPHNGRVIERDEERGRNPRQQDTIHDLRGRDDKYRRLRPGVRHQ